MKRILSAVLILSAISADARQPELKVDTLGEKFRKYQNILGQYSLLPRATYSHSTSQGKIYIMPYDNMPCLVPDMKKVAPMPRRSMPSDGNMPNILPKQFTIPEEKEEDNNK